MPRSRSRPRPVSTSVAVAFALLVFGCTSAGGDSAVTASTSTTTQPPASSAPQPTRTPLPDTGPSADAVVPGPCDGDDRAALSAVVQDQLAAFATGDFAAARGLASSSFRSAVDLDRFEALITEQYGIVLADPAVAVGTCVTDGQRGVLEVGLTPEGGSEVDLVYVLAREDGAWRIEGAQSSELPGGGDLGTPV